MNFIAKMRKRRYKETALLILLVVCVVFGAAYIFHTARYYESQTKNGVMNLALSAESFVCKEKIRQLEASPNDIGNAIYEEVKAKLTTFKKYNENVRFAYLLTEKEGALLILADSEPPGSKDYSPPSQNYYEATEQHLQPFIDKEAILTEAYTDRWGTWVSVLVPIIDPADGSVLAVLGIDYPADAYYAQINKHILHAVVIVSCILLMVIAIYYMFIKRIQLKSLNKKFEESAELFSAVFEQAPVGIAIINEDESVSLLNSVFCGIIGRSKQDLGSLRWTDLTHPEDRDKDRVLQSQFKKGKIKNYGLEKRFVKPDGSFVWVHMVVTGLRYGKNENSHLCIIEDIHERKLAEAALQESERNKAALLSHMPGIAYRCLYDRDWTMKYVSDGCFELTGHQPGDIIDNKTLSYSALIAPEYRARVWQEWKRVIAKKQPFRSEYEIITASGVRKWVLEMGQGIFSEAGQAEALEGLIIDISKHKQREEKILYLSDHDPMTGLFNRMHFEDAKSRLDNKESLPLSIITADINGLRMVNDAFGYEEGDRMIKQTAKIIQKCCADRYVVARTGGDTFSLLMPNTDKRQAREMMEALRAACERHNTRYKDKARSINLSMGYGTKLTEHDTIKAAEKEAEENMNKNKLLERKSHHSAILSSVMATMYARSQETEAHAERLTVLCRKAGAELGLSEKALNELELLCMLHDIGKVGIDDRILNKPGTLTNEEWTIMKKHSEIGSRIAKATPELEPIAEYILSHHERWDGTGYPQGLKGEDIPLLSRILFVADAFDAMTEDRVYRKALTKQDAIEEIKRNAGTQFDPHIVKLFIESILV